MALATGPIEYTWWATRPAASALPLTKPATDAQATRIAKDHLVTDAQDRWIQPASRMGGR